KQSTTHTDPLSLHDALPILARRGMHDEAAELLRTRLANKLAMDLNTARRLFTLICAIQPYARHGHEQEEQLPAVLFVCSMNSVRDRKSTRLNSSHVKSSYAV